MKNKVRLVPEFQRKNRAEICWFDGGKQVSSPQQDPWHKPLNSCRMMSFNLFFLTLLKRSVHKAPTVQIWIFSQRQEDRNVTLAVLTRRCQPRNKREVQSASAELYLFKLIRSCQASPGEVTMKFSKFYLFKIQVASLATPKSFHWALSILGLDGQLFTGDQTERHNNRSWQQTNVNIQKQTWFS